MDTIIFDKKEVLKVLLESPLTAYLSDIQRDQILLFAETVSYSAGENVISLGDMSPFLYVILEGRAGVQIVNAQGQKVALAALGKGETFGETGLFVNVKRTADIIALQKLTLLKIKREDFIRFLKNNPEAGVKMLTVVVYNLLERLRGAHQEIGLDKTQVANQPEMRDFLRQVSGDSK